MSSAANTCDVFWAPFKSDCENLLRRFQQTESVRFEAFAAIWRDMDFSSIFYGMITRHEKKSFSRLAFVTVYSYFFPPYSFQIRVGALYMFYGLYHTQVAQPKEKIWIPLKDWVHVQRFVCDALHCQHLDVLYVYRKLLSEKAIFFTAMPKQLMFDAKRRYLKKGFNEKFQDQSSGVMELVSTDTFDEISNVHDNYERIKKALSVSSFISVTPVNLAARLQESILELSQWKEKHADKTKKDPGVEVKDSIKEVKSPSRADALASIKSRAHSHLFKASRSRRHRQMEMDTDSAQDFLDQCKKKVSLRARTRQSLGKKGVPEESDRRQHWLLSSTEEDRAAFKRSQKKNRFKW